jgi:hypothetical protein
MVTEMNRIDIAKLAQEVFEESTGLRSYPAYEQAMVKFANTILERYMDSQTHRRYSEEHMLEFAKWHCEYPADITRDKLKDFNDQHQIL